MIPRDNVKNRLDNSTPPREDVGVVEPGIDSDRVIVAATLAGNDWPVLALDHGTKTPAHGHSDRPNHGDYWLTTPEAAASAALDYQRTLYDRGKSFPDPNFGVVTGVSLGADHLALVALDVDGGTEALAELLREAGPEAEEWARDTVRVSHGDPGRCHLYGLLDARQGAMLRTLPHLGDGLEFRGLGGYIVAPGSLHPDGRTYEITGGELIVNDGGQPDHGIYDGLEDDDCNTMSARWRVPREVPLALLRVLIDRGAAGVDDRDGEDDVKIKEAPGDLEELPPEPSDHRCGSGALEARLDGAVVKVRTAPPGTGNDRLNKSARVCGALVAAYSEELAGRDKEIREELVSAFLARPTVESKGSREREARSTIRSGWESGAHDWAEILADRNGEIRRSAPDPLLRSPRSAGTHDDDEEVLAVADPTAMTEPQDEDGEPAGETAAGVHVAEGPRVIPCKLYGVIGHDPLACPDCLAARERAREIYRDRRAVASGLPGVDTLMMPGGAAILDAPACPVPVWGRGSRVLWAEGESLILLGAAGLGKTTLAQQLALGRCGAPGFADLLGLPVAPDGRRVLYLAMDRPRQAQRSMARMVGEDLRGLLDSRLRIWAGPPPVTLTDHPERLAEMCEQAGAGTVVVDSLKDTGSVVDDEGGTGWNRARQLALAAGVEVLELQHPRKLPEGQTMPRLEDSYGSTWITAGAGSVLALGGRAGDRVVKLEHLKQPAEAWGPAEMAHDHVGGRSHVVERVDLVAHAAASGPVTVAVAAQLLTGTTEPARRDKEAARRKLNELTDRGLMVQLSTAQGRKSPATWGAAVSGAR